MPPETGHNVAQLQSMLSHSEGSAEEDDTCFAVLLHVLSAKSKINDASVFTKCGSDQISGFFVPLDGALSNNLMLGGQGEIVFGVGFMIREFFKGIGLYRNMIGDTEMLHQIMGELAQDMSPLTDPDTSSTGGEGDSQVRDEQEAYASTSQGPDFTPPSYDHGPSESFSHADAYRQKKSSSKEEEHDSGRGL
ncbi:hypothetical protein GUI12_03855 [Anaplasmataceae bacterium AB001_6]|nr:hypothetical protein GUI12_03855 [Anaplasmataceae bacterium AB001_6]